MQSKANLSSDISSKSNFANIPVCDLNEETDFSQLSDYLIYQGDDYVNAIFSILKSNNFNRPIKKIDKASPINRVFQDFFDDINRRVVFFSNPPLLDPSFVIKPNRNIFTYFHPLIKWKCSMSNLKMPIGQFMTNPQNFYTYCFHFFKIMIGESMSQINLNEWCLSSEIPKASDVISDAIFDAVDIKSYFESELGCLLMIISKIPYWPLKDTFTTPYIFENGFCCEIHRNQKQFSYKIKYRDYFSIESINDSIAFQPNESLCIHYNFPFGCNIIFNEQSILFDGEKLILIENDKKISYITAEGVFISNAKDIIIIDQYGTISQKIDNKWDSVTANSVSYTDGKEVKRKYTYITDYRTGIKSMIRPDRIEYYISPNKTKRILFNSGLSIEQRDSSNIIYDIPNFPLITFNKGSFMIEMSGIELTFSHCKTVYIKSSLFASSFDGDKLSIDVPQFEKIELKINECNVRSATTTLHADSRNQKDLFESTVSLSDIQKKFPLRFFAIRSDFSGVEFVRKDSELLKDAIFQSSKMPHPYGGLVNVLGAHFKDIEKVPFIFIENQPIKLPDDEIKLKNIFEGDDELVRIECDRKLFVSDNISFARLLESFLETENENHHAKYVNIVDFASEAELPMPFNTPSPRMLNMQYNLHQEKIKDLKKGSVLNYFKSHEADFALIENEYEIIIEEEEEEEILEKVEVEEVGFNEIESSVNFNLKQFEISGVDIDLSDQKIINDVPPPPLPQKK